MYNSFKFKDIIELGSRIPGNKIKLTKLKETCGYFPGVYFTDYFYSDARGNIWWLRDDSDIDNFKGSSLHDWTMIPPEVISFIKKDFTIK